MSNDINVGAISEALNNKVDLNQMNTNAQGLSYGSGWGMPSGRFINLNYVSGGEYIAPANGFFSLTMSVPNNSTGGGCELLNKNTQLRNGGWNIWTRSASCFIPAKKGDVIIAYQSESNSVTNFRFYYAEGEQ